LVPPAATIDGDESFGRDRAILDFERTRRQQPGPKEVAIREHFRMSPRATTRG
jgi:hypothetical protein